MNANTDFFPFVVESVYVVITQETTYTTTGVKYGETKTITIKGEGHKSIQLVNPGHNVFGIDFMPLVGRTLLAIDETDGVAYFMYETEKGTTALICVHLNSRCEIVYKSGA